VPATVRDILLTIRAKEEASRSINNVSRAMRKASAEASAASARARAAALRGQAEQARMNAQVLRAQAAQAQLAGATRAQIGVLKDAARAQDTYARNLSKAARSEDDHAKSIGNSSKRLTALSGNFADAGNVAQTTGLVMLAAGGMAAYGLKGAIDTAVEWDKQVRLTYTQVDKRLNPTLQELGDIGLRVAGDVAVPFETIQTALFDVFSSTEASLPEAEQLLRSFAKAAVAGNTDIRTASRATIGLMNTYKIPFEDVNKILDIQFQLVQEGVGTYEEWSERIGLVTPSAARAGQNIETMAAALSTATRQGMSSARAGTAVARAFDAMSNPKTEKALQRIGVKTRDAKGNFRPLVDVLTDWRRELEKLPKEDRVKALLDTLKGAGSTIEARRFLQNILLTEGGLELFQDQIKEFSSDKGAFQRAYDDMAGTVSSKTTLLRNAWMKLKLAIGEALLPAFSDVIDFAQRVLDAFNRLPKPVKNAIAQVLLWGTIAAIVGGGVAILIGGIIGIAGIIAAAGTAIFPVIAIMAGLAAVIGLVVTGIGLLIAGFVLAYQKSEPFREMIKSIWRTVQGLWEAIKIFGLRVWALFQETVVPAFEDLWAVLERHLFPAAKEFIDWFNAEMLPILKRGAEWLATLLYPAFQLVADVIRDHLIPFIIQLTVFYKENEEEIKILAKAAVIAALVFGAVLVGAIGAVIAAFALMMVTVIFVGKMIVAVANDLIQRYRAMSAGASIALDRIRDGWNKLWGGARIAAVNTIIAAQQMVARIRGFFAGAGTWLLQAGRDMVAGFVNGIRAMAGQAVAEARGIAGAAAAAARNALGIRSPSKVFKDIGANVIKGFVNGILGGRDKVVSTMKSLSEAIRKSIQGADISKAAKAKMQAKWNDRLAKTQAKLLGLEAKRAGLQKKLETAQDKYNDLIKERDDLSQKIEDAIRRSSDITSLDDKELKSSGSIRTALQSRLKDAQDFAKNLQTLAARGFDKETISQLASQGVEAAGKTAATLANASSDDLKAISKTQEEIRKIADATGNKISGDLYNAGIKAAKGFVDGLNSQIKALEKTMSTIAQALVKQIKKELGIKSPSRVFADIGMNTAQGYINGYMANMNANNSTLAAASMFSPAGARVGFGAGGRGVVNPGVTKIFHQNITVNTQEIDPRKTSAELGWELEGRM
jgi:TP901 family phage tail tape measure protein